MNAAIESFPVTDAYRGMRLDRFLQAMLPRMSRTSIQEAIGSRVALGSGATAKAARRLTVGEVVQIGPRPVEAAAHESAGERHLPVLASGTDWLVIDKPGGLATTPSARRRGDDVASLLRMAPAHRLDRGTSGCLLLTSHRATARAFDLAFRARRIDKQYVAVVTGTPPSDQFEIDARLGPDPDSRVPGKVAVSASGVPATTRIEVLARVGDRTIVLARPLTGRRHQIRVHLAHLDLPIVGDLLYGGDERRFIRHQLGQVVDTPPGLATGRHLLHAVRLGFEAPATNFRVEVEAPWPADFGLGQDVPDLPPRPR